MTTNLSYEELSAIATQPTPAEARAALAEIDQRNIEQDSIWRATEAEEHFSKKFNTALEQFRQDKERIDNELLQLRSTVEAYVQKRLTLARQAGEVEQIAKWLAGARVRTGAPDGSADWNIQGLAEQLVMNVNGGDKRLMLMPEPPRNDRLLQNLADTVMQETGENFPRRQVISNIPASAVEQSAYKRF